MWYKLKKIYVWDKLVRPKWIPCTITWSTVFSTKASFSEWSDIQGCYISPDGTKMYIPYWSNKRLYQYSLSTPRDVSTATAVRYISVTTPDGIWLNDSWTLMFISNENLHIIQRYTLSTAWDISTAVADQSLSVGSSYFAWNICFAKWGKELYFWKYSWSQDSQYRYTLTTAYDLTTATQTSVVAGWLYSPFVSNNGKYYYMEWVNIWTTIQYELSTPYDISWTKTQIGSYSQWTSDGRWFFVSQDGQYRATSSWIDWIWITVYKAQPI